MKIKYPGQAVATSNLPSSHHHHSSLGLLYEANWANANDRITPTPLSTYTKSNVNASSLGKYQRHLEQIKAYEIERVSDDSSQSRTVKDFHGYKPSTLKREKSQKQLNQWDDELKYRNIFHNPLYTNQTAHNWHSSDFLNGSSNGNKEPPPFNNENYYRPKNNDPKIKRSQTVIVKQPTSQFSAHNRTAADELHGDFDVKDFYRRRAQLRQAEEKHQNRFQKSLSIHSREDDDDGGSNSVNAINNTNFNNGKHHRNCDSMSNIRNDSSFNFNSSSSAANLSKLTLDNASHYITANRMNCYKIPNFAASSENVGKPHDRTVNEKILLNPLARNRSIKINHFDSVRRKSQKSSDDDGRLCDFNGNSCEKTSLSSNSSAASSSAAKLKKKNSFSRMFYNTISAGSKFPRVFLGRTKSQRSKLNLDELSEQMESPNSTSSVSTLSSTSSKQQQQSNHSQHDAQNQAKVKSGSISSDSDSFLIPRPRLIVPVHLPRKRRTGNLIDSVATEANKSATLKSLKCDRKQPTNRGNFPKNWK